MFCQMFSAGSWIFQPVFSYRHFSVVVPSSAASDETWLFSPLPQLTVALPLKRTSHGGCAVVAAGGGGGEWRLKGREAPHLLSSLSPPEPHPPSTPDSPFKGLFPSWSSLFSPPFYKLPADISLGAAPGQLLSKSLIQQAKQDRIPNNPEPVLPASSFVHISHSLHWSPRRSPGMKSWKE